MSQSSCVRLMVPKIHDANDQKGDSSEHSNNVRPRADRHSERRVAKGKLSDAAFEAFGTRDGAPVRSGQHGSCEGSLSIRGSQSLGDAWKARPEGLVKGARLFHRARKQEAEEIVREEYNVCSLYWETGNFQHLARDEHFANLTLFVISINAAYLGIDADWNDAVSIYQAHAGFIVAEILFCIFFLFEILVRFGAFRVKLTCLRDT